MGSFYFVTVFAMQCLLYFFVGAMLPAMVFSDLVCDYPLPAVPTDWIEMNRICIAHVRDLIDSEMAVATQYLALAAYHLRVNVSRPGYAELFIASADEHRGFAKRLITYLTMRGQNVNDIDSLLHMTYTPWKKQWDNVVSALQFVLGMEGDVTDRFRNVIGVCQDQTFNDYNLNNWLTKEFLYLQYDNMKWWADALSTLQKVWNRNGYYGEFLKDIQYQEEYCD